MNTPTATAEEDTHATTAAAAPPAPNPAEANATTAITAAASAAAAAASAAAASAIPEASTAAPASTPTVASSSDSSASPAPSLPDLSSASPAPSSQPATATPAPAADSGSTAGGEGADLTPATSGDSHPLLPPPLDVSGTSAGDESRSHSNASDAPPPAAGLQGLGHKPLPLLSLPALPGQKLCPCMRGVAEVAQRSTPAAAHAGSGGVGGGTESLSPRAPPLSPPPPVDRLLSLQDRFWLSVGEVALHNDGDCVERGVDAMESVAAQLAHQAQQLAHTMLFLRDEQRRAVAGLMHELEAKNRALVAGLQAARAEEAMVRERIDALSLKVEKAKKTVAMGGTLSLARAKLQREQDHLDSVRRAHDAAQRQLESIVHQRSAAHHQMLNVSTIANECRLLDVEQRDYTLMARQVNSTPFLRSFGAAYQQQVANLVKCMASLRDASHECARRKRSIEHTIHELRGRIALVVSAYWK